MDPERARELLAKARSQVEDQLDRLRPEPDEELSHLDNHPADDATDLFEQELEEGLSDTLRERLSAIERAEHRLEQGTYGLSVESGDPIPDDRLEVVPWAERTVEEEKRITGA